jgi:hypothetical protein
MPHQSFRFLNPDSPRRAPNYGARTMQFKLLMMVGTLFAVVWCMQYAGRPETWQWLFSLDESGHANRREMAVDPIAESEPSPTVDLDNDRADPVWPNPWRTAEKPSRLPISLEALYWRNALPRLTPEEKFALVDAVNQWSRDLAPTISPETVLRSALIKLTNLRQHWDQQVNSTVVLSGPAIENRPADPWDTSQESTDERLDSDQTDLDLPSLNPAAAVRSLFALPKSISQADAQAVTDHSRWLSIQWNPLIQSAAYAESPEDPTDGGKSLLLSEAVANRDHWKLLGSIFLDPHLMSTITDGSRLGRPEERAAWLRFIHQTQPSSLSQSSTKTAETITLQNLLGQPDAFRGLRVRVTGTIRRIELVRQTDPVVAKAMPAAEYAIAWLQPAISGQGPYCVYCTGDSKLKELAESNPDPRRMAIIDAMFFKLYPYTTANGKTAVCPLLVTDKIDLSPLRPDPPQTTLGSGEWFTVIGCISLLAILLATAGYYSTRYRSANPLGARKRDAARVDWLDSSPVPSPSESLNALSAREPTSEKSHDRS